jgi:hypothetical protein
MTSYVIRIERGRRGIAWFTGHLESENESEAMAFATPEQAERMRSLCGLYHMLGWPTSVERSRVPVNVGGVNASVKRESSKGLTKKMERRRVARLTGQLKLL